MEETRNACTIFEVKPVGGMKRMWWINVKLELREMSCYDKEVDRTGSGS